MPNKKLVSMTVSRKAVLGALHLHARQSAWFLLEMLESNRYGLSWVSLAWTTWNQSHCMTSLLHPHHETRSWHYPEGIASCCCLHAGSQRRGKTMVLLSAFSPGYSPRFMVCALLQLGVHPSFHQLLEDALIICTTILYMSSHLNCHPDKSESQRSTL